jgi:glucokinase
MFYLVGLDIGGTKCAVILAELSKGISIIDKVQFPTEVEKGFEHIKNIIFNNIRYILKSNKLSTRDIKAIGVSCGGPLDSRKGLIMSPPNLPGWDSIPFVEMLQKEFGVKAFIQNDANACALVEWKLGAGRGTENMMFLTMGTGMGAGIIAEGRLIVGASDMAGEVGHVRLEKDGPLGYGKKGSFEGFCSGGGISRLAKEKVGQWISEGKAPSWCLNLDQTDAIDTKLISDIAKSGDIQAKEIFNIVGEKPGKAIAMFMDILHPELVVVGSIFGRSGELFIGSMKSEIEKEALTYTKDACKVVSAETGESIGDFASIMVAVYGLNMDVGNIEEADKEVIRIYERLFVRYPALIPVKDRIFEAYEILEAAYLKGGKLLVCGNGGSAADADHIVGELMKGFYKRREIKIDFANKLREIAGETVNQMASCLQMALPAIALTQHNALSTAFLNDISSDMVFAQQVFGYGDSKDILIAISTSGNSSNVLNAAIVAKAKGMKIIGMTGPSGGKLSENCDVLINVAGEYTADIQELHLPVYHTICAMLEEKFF